MPSSTAWTARLRSAAWAAPGRVRASSFNMRQAYRHHTLFACLGDICSSRTPPPPKCAATGTFTSGKDGQVTASLTVNPPASDISCPPGQSLELASVSYTNITLTDTTNGVMISVPDVNSACLLPNVRGAC